MNNSLPSDDNGQKVVYLMDTRFDTYQHNDAYFESLYEAFQRYGITLIPINFGAGDWKTKIMSYAQNEEVLFFFGLNGFGNDISGIDSDQKPTSLFELVNKPYLTSFSDPPFIEDMWDHTQNSFVGKIYLYTDHSYLAFSRLFQDSSQESYFYSGFCPNFTSEVNTPYQNREINFLLPMTLVDPDCYYHNFLEECSQELIIAKGIFEKIVETFLLNLRSDFLDWINVGFIHNGLLFNPHIDWQRKLLHYTSNYIKFKRREILVNTLKELPVTLITNELSSGIELHKDTQVLSPMPFQDFQKILGQTKLCICPTPHYRGFHERIISAMYQNCLVLTNPNQILEENFVDSRDILIYQNLEKDVLEKINYCIQEPEKAEQAALQAQSIALEIFSPDQAVSKIMNIYENYQQYQKRKSSFKILG